MKIIQNILNIFKEFKKEVLNKNGGNTLNKIFSSKKSNSV